MQTVINTTESSGEIGSQRFQQQHGPTKRHLKLATLAYEVFSEPFGITIADSVVILPFKDILLQFSW